MGRFYEGYYVGNLLLLASYGMLRLYYLSVGQHREATYSGVHGPEDMSNWEKQAMATVFFVALYKV